MLSKAPVFSGAYTEDLRVLARELEEEACFAGEWVFDINDPSDRMYIIESGKIGISVHKDPKVKEFHSTLGPGDCFGELGVIDGQPRSATAHVLEEGVLLVLDKAKLRAVSALPRAGARHDAQLEPAAARDDPAFIATSGRGLDRPPFRYLVGEGRRGPLRPR